MVASQPLPQHTHNHFLPAHPTQLAANLIGNSSDPRVPEWARIASRVYLPVTESLFKGGPVHPEYTGYHGQTINQADVALLQYPLDLAMAEDIARNDLTYYTSVTDPNGAVTH